MAHHQASPTQLKTGEWGARVRASQVRIGDELTIVTKTGSSWKAIVQGVVWQGDDAAICRTARTVKAHSGYCSECGRRAVDAPFHAAMGGLCGECAFDEYDM